jgi:hypothetical protein
MNQAANILQSLRKLAKFDTELRKLSRDTQQYQEMLDKIESQRAPLPTSILVHYDRRTARGKLAIAPVRRGVCGACNLSIPSGRLAELRGKPGELNVCDNCGVFIYLTEDESVAPSKSASDDRPARELNAPTLRACRRRRHEGWHPTVDRRKKLWGVCHTLLTTNERI